MFKRVWCLYICICVQGYTRLRCRSPNKFVMVAFWVCMWYSLTISWKRKASISHMCWLMSSMLLILQLSGHHGTRGEGIEKLMDFLVLPFLVSFYCLGSLTQLFLEVVFLESAIALLRSFTNLIEIIWYAPFISKQCLNWNAMLVLIIEQSVKTSYDHWALYQNILLY